MTQRNIIIVDGTQDQLDIPEGAKLTVLKEPMMKVFATLDPTLQYEFLLTGEDEEAGLGDALQTMFKELNYIQGSWIASLYNALVFYRRKTTSLKKLAETRPPEKEIAVCVGNGFSIDGLFGGWEWSDKAEIFTCWHAYDRILQQGVKADYVLHKDWRAPVDIPIDNDYSGVSFIGSPSASPKFWVLALKNDQNKRFHYLDGANVESRYWSDFFKEDMDPDCIGTVSEMVIHSAAARGHKKIVIAGMDLLTYPAQPLNESIYLQYKEELEAVIASYPDIEFYSVCEGGVYLKGTQDISAQLFMDGEIVPIREAAAKIRNNNRKKLILPKGVDIG